MDLKHWIGEEIHIVVIHVSYHVHKHEHDHVLTS